MSIKKLAQNLRAPLLACLVMMIGPPPTTAHPPSRHAPAAAIACPPHVEALGRTGQLLAAAYERLCRPPLNDLDFVLADVRLDMTRRFTQYSGDISGRMLGALQSAAPVLGRSSPMAEQIAAALPAAQKPDGHFGCPQDLDHLDQRRDMPILWGNGRLLLAIAQRLAQKNDPALLDTARKLGRYIIATRKYYGKKENFQQVGGHFSSGFTTCYPSLIDGLAALARVTGDRRFADEARFIARLSLLDDRFEHRHSHGRLTAFRGMLDLDRYASSPQFVPLVADKVDHITNRLALPSGGITEVFNRDNRRDEGCSEADWIRVNFLLWQATGRTGYLDTAEHAINNHLAATQQSNGGFGHCFWGPLRHGSTDYPGARLLDRATESYWCCSMHVTQALADIARWSVLSRGSDLLVTWLGEARARFSIDNKTVTVAVSRTGPASWQVHLVSTNSLPLLLRVPGWAGTIRVNGRERPAENGWTRTIARPDQALQVEFPDDIQLRGPYGPTVLPGRPVRLFAAGQLYCLPESQLADGWAGSDRVPRVLLAADRPDRQKIPVLLVRSDHTYQRASLVPLASRPWGGCRLLFDVQRIDKQQFERDWASAQPPADPGLPVQLHLACDGRAEAYLNGRRVFFTSHWVENPAVQAFCHAGNNVLAIKVFSDRPRPGLIATLKTPGRLHVSGQGPWTAIPCDQQIDPQWLTRPDTPHDKAVKITDLGPFGTEPWKHIPAGFAGSGARWVWPESDGRPDRQWWLLRYPFHLPPRQNHPPQPSP